MLFVGVRNEGVRLREDQSTTCPLHITGGTTHRSTFALLAIIFVLIFFSIFIIIIIKLIVSLDADESITSVFGIDLALLVIPHGRLQVAGVVPSATEAAAVGIVVGGLGGKKALVPSAFDARPFIGIAEHPSSVPLAIAVFASKTEPPIGEKLLDLAGELAMLPLP